MAYGDVTTVDMTPITGIRAVRVQMTAGWTYIFFYHGNLGGGSSSSCSCNVDDPTFSSVTPAATIAYDDPSQRIIRITVYNGSVNITLAKSGTISPWIISAAFAGTSSGGGGTGGTNGQIQYNNAGSFGGFTMSGDATLNTSTGVITVSGASSTRAVIAAAGSTQGTATAITATRNYVTSATGTGGILLPAGATLALGMREVFARAGSTLLLYPTGSETIEGGSASAPISLFDKNMARVTYDGTTLRIG